MTKTAKKHKADKQAKKDAKKRKLAAGQARDATTADLRRRFKEQADGAAAASRKRTPRTTPRTPPPSRPGATSTRPPTSSSTPAATAAPLRRCRAPAAAAHR